MDYRTMELTLYRRLMFRLFAAAAGLIIGWIFYDGIVPGIAAGLALMTREDAYKEMLLEKRRRELLSQFKDLLYSVSSSVSTGRSLGQALEESIEFWKGTYDDKDYIIAELRQMVKDMRESNISDIEAFGDFARRSGLPDAEDFVMVCRTCKATGADFSKAAGRSADIIEDKISVERELTSMMVQKRFEGRIIATAPFALVFMIKLLSPEYMAPLYEAASGKVVATVCLALMAAGFAAVERVMKVEI